MSSKFRKLIVVSNIIIAIFITAFFCFYIFIMSTWPIDDNQIASMKDMDWAKQGFTNTCLDIAVGTGIGLVLYFTSKKMFNCILRDKNSKIPKYIALISICASTITSIAGGIIFYIKKPYI